MKWLWIAGLSLSIIQMNAPDRLSIRHLGQTVIELDRSDYTLPVFPLVNPDQLDRLLRFAERQAYQEPVNAQINPAGGITPEQIGYKLDRSKFTDQFYAFLYGHGSLSIDLPRTAVFPKVDSELLAYIREKPIGHYATYFNARNKNRSHNIALAAKSINNHVVFPGETFSFNTIVGQRTKEWGYSRAPVIVRGELAEDIGGGICQVSSTLFNAIDRAGLKIMQRYSHSRHVPYVPPGRDATVSWGGPDFSFLNQYNQPILIRAFAGPGRIIITIHSSEMIQYQPREVPGMSKRIPEEISIQTDVRHPVRP